MRLTRCSVSLILLSLLSGCAKFDYQQSVELTSLKIPTQAISRFSYQSTSYHPDNRKDYEKDLAALKTLQSDHRRQVKAHWGELALYSTNYRYVKYTNNYRSRSIIDFDLGFVQVESLDEDYSKQYLQQAIKYTLLAPESPTFTDFYTSYTSEIQSEPFLYRQVKDQDGKYIKWDWRAARYAKYLVENKVEQSQQSAKILSKVSFSLVKNHTAIRAKRYLPVISGQAKTYNIDPKLVQSIIKQESRYNPYALNVTERVGLMQIGSNTQGKDVFKQKKWSYAPSQAYLFDVKNNLDIGIGYLNLLDKHYLKDIKDENARNYATIASYIAGPRNMLQTFSKDREEAFEIINSLTAYEVYQSLTTKQSRPEIKEYLYEVNSTYRQLSK